jgi:hypothetical protein
VLLVEIQAAAIAYGGSIYLRWQKKKIIACGMKYVTPLAKSQKAAMQAAYLWGQKGEEVMPMAKTTSQCIYCLFCFLIFLD